MCVALKEDGSVLITGQGKLVFVWDVVTGTQTSFKKGHADIVRCLAVKDERVCRFLISSGDRAKLYLGRE